MRIDLRDDWAAEYWYEFNQCRRSFGLSRVVAERWWDDWWHGKSLRQYMGMEP